MSTALAVAQQPQTLAASEVAWSPEQTALIKRTVAPEASNDELAMFLHVAAKAGLDPLQKQVWFVKRSGRVTIQAGVDGLQARALRMPDCEGIMSAAVYEREDFLFDKAKGEVVRHQSNPFGAAGQLVGAWGVVRRAGKAPFVALVRFQEYADSNSPLWKSKPGVMLEKVARSTALRRAYPEAFGGIYEPAEMGKAALAEAHQGEEPAPAAGNAPALPATVDAEVVPPTPEPQPEPPKPEAKPATPATVGELWDKALAEYGDDREKVWRECCIRVFGRKVPPPAQWTEQQTKDVEFALFGRPAPADQGEQPNDIPF